MTELRDQVRDTQIFKKLDLKDCLYLIRICKGNEWKTAFRTLYRHYQHWVIPFGLVNGPTTVQTMMNQILPEFLDQGLVVSIDDILIYSKTVEEQIILIRKVLQRLCDYRMAISREKSVFHIKMMDLLGLVVARDVMTMKEKKLESVKLGKLQYRLRMSLFLLGSPTFTEGWSEILQLFCVLITNLLKGDSKKFFWGKEQEG